MLGMLKVFRSEGPGMWAVCDVPMTRTWRVRANGFRVMIYNARHDRFLKTNAEMGRKILATVLATNPPDKYRTVLERARQEDLGARR